MRGSKNLINLIRSYKFRKKNKKDTFNYFGLELILGKFGSGKTLTVVDRVSDIISKNPNVRVITNFDLKFKIKNYYYCDNEFDFLSVLLQVLSKDVDLGCIVIVDEVKLFLSETLRDDKSRRCNAFLTVLGQVRKLNCLFILTSQLYNKTPKVLRDFILQNGDIVICKRLFPGFTYYMYYDMSTITETSRITLEGKFKRFDYCVHTPELYKAYDTSCVVSSVAGLLKE